MSPILFSFISFPFNLIFFFTFSVSLSHVVKTGDIKDLVIMEEAGIAKGIRRIIAVTGEEAKHASLRATETEAVFAKLVKLEGKEKDKALKVYETVSVSLHLSLEVKYGLMVFFYFI